MDYTINTSKDWQTTIDVSLTADDIKAKYSQAVANVQKSATLQGFRKGKVPAAMVKQLFGAQIATEAVDIGLEDAWRKVFQENEFDVYNDPAITNRKFQENGDVTFSIVFDQHPRVEVAGFEGMDVDKTVWEVTPEDVDLVMEDMRQRHAMLYTSEEPAKSGDYIVGDLQETDRSGVPIIGGRFENQQIWLGPQSELTPQLAGVKSGDERQVILKVKAPETELVDKPFESKENVKVYSISVKEVKERRLPDLDDEFAKDIGERYQTLQELREAIEHDLKHRAEHETQYAFEEALSMELVKRVDLELPPSMIDHYMTRVIEDMRRDQKGKPFDEDQVRTIYRPKAIYDLKWHLVADQVKKQQNFTATEEDIAAKLEHYHLHPDAEENIKRIRKDNREMARLKDQIIFDKLYAFLASQSNVHEDVRPFREFLTASHEHDGDE